MKFSEGDRELLRKLPENIATLESRVGDLERRLAEVEVAQADTAGAFDRKRL